MLKLIYALMVADSMRSYSTSHYVAARRGVVSMRTAKWHTSTKSLISDFGRELVSSPTKQAGIPVSCVKTSDASVIDKSDGECFFLPQYQPLLQ